jgi:methylmalonyl-CoA mutase cobalamin-binding subunit
MRDNGSPEAEIDGDQGWYGRLAQEALTNLLLVRSARQTRVRQDHLDHFIALTETPAANDPEYLLQAMLDRRLELAAIAHHYVPEAARVIGEQWVADEITFVAVTVRTERLHRLVRRIDEMLGGHGPATGPACLVLVPEGEQHTLGAFVLAMKLRSAGLTALVRVGPSASELAALLQDAGHDLALVSVGCENGLPSAVALVRLIRELAGDGLRIMVGGAIPISDKALLFATGADRVGRSVDQILAEFATAERVTA